MSGDCFPLIGPTRLGNEAYLLSSCILLRMIYPSSKSPYIDIYSDELILLGVSD